MRLVTRIIAGLGDTEERAAGRTAEQRIYGFAHKMLKIESWIWTSIANSRVFWTQTTDMFAATFRTRRFPKRLRHFAKTVLEISVLGASTPMHQ